MMIIYHYLIIIESLTLLPSLSRYHYRYLPSCLYGVSTADAVKMRKVYVDDVYELLDRFDNITLDKFKNHAYPQVLLGIILYILRVCCTLFFYTVQHCIVVLN